MNEIIRHQSLAIFELPVTRGAQKSDIWILEGIHDSNYFVRIINYTNDLSHRNI